MTLEQFPSTSPSNNISTQTKQKPSATIQNKNLIESLLYLKQNNLIQDSKSTLRFESTKEAEDSKKEDVIYAIKEKLSTTKQEITELQKSGYNLHLEGIKLIKIPLKEKIWLATLTKQDLEKIFKTLKEVNTIITPLKKENEEKIAEKERLEKLANQKTKIEATKTTTRDPSSSSTKPQSTTVATTTQEQSNKQLH